MKDILSIWLSHKAPKKEKKIFDKMVSNLRFKDFQHFWTPFLPPKFEYTAAKLTVVFMMDHSLSRYWVPLQISFWPPNIYETTTVQTLVFKLEVYTKRDTQLHEIHYSECSKHLQSSNVHYIGQYGGWYTSFASIFVIYFLMVRVSTILSIRRWLLNMAFDIL